jgi:EAL domain-containing protein (putative c-di-GMP-specific phosphodiesterase class I)
MYRAKDIGRNKAVYFTAEMNAGSRKQLALETSLRQAVAKNQLQLHYQPKIDTTRNAIVGVEALLRWEHPTMGNISPMEFIPVAEDSGLIVPIGEWVLNTAFKQLKQWHKAGYTELTMAVNISSAQLSRPGFEEVVEKALQTADLDAGSVELEITENVAMENLESATLILEKLKRLGIRIAMDDFGTGYSSLSHLRRLPVDVVKIDKSFVREIPESHEDVLIAQAIIAMAQSLNLSLVVEGVENVKQLNFFRQQGCNIVQGFLFSKPVEACEIHRMLATQSAPGTVNLVK